MAINHQKFLPPSKIPSPTTSIVKVEKVVPSLYKRIEPLSPESDDVGGVGGELLVIKTKVINISNLVSSNTLLKKKTEKENRKEKENKTREEKENKLEKKDNKLISKLPSFNLPKLGFLDAINRFITFTLLGWVFKRIYPYIPQILDFIRKIDPVIKFVETLAGNFFKGVVDFIDFGYKAHDTVRDFTKKIGGENLQKTFDDFTKNLNTFVELALIAGMLSTGGPNLGRPGGGPGGGKPGKGGDWRTEGNVIKGKGGYKQAYDNMLKKGNLTKGEQRVVRDYKRLVKAGYHPDSAANQAFFRNRPEWLSGRNVRGGGFSVETAKDYRTAAKGNVVKPKLRLSFGKGIFGRVPIIGGLLDFAFSLAMGEPVGRAAAKAVGSTIGAALGTFIPIPLAGTILGGILGDIVGGALYDTLTANKPKKMSSGGKVTTRKGKVVGGKVKRTVRRVTAPSKAKQVKPGTSVGGEKKVKQIYPEPPKNQIGRMMNPYGILTDTTKEMGAIPFLGPLFNIFGKTILGDSPTRDDYKIIGSSINAWINNAISKGVLQGNLMSAFADGGVVDIESEMKRNISGWVEKSVEELVRNKVTTAINNLRKNLGLKPLQENVTGQDVTDEMGELGSASDAVGGARLFMKAGFPMLAAAILAGNIQQESGWRGQRTPWVLNDGVGTNKGLISWNQDRITNAERFLGKPLETASNAEQIKWIKEELKQYGLLDEFMDPNRTEEQLKSDSYKYIGWGDLGDRWKYSKQIFQSLQRGEVGTYKPPTASGLGTASGSLQIAKSLAESMGVPLYSHIRRDDPDSYHYDGRAMDFSNDAVGRGTPQQLALAKELVKRYGTTAKEIFYTPLGFSIKDGRVVRPPIAASTHYNHVHVAFKKGGQIGEQKVKPLQKQASYEEGSGSMIYILPIHIKEQVPVPMGNSRVGFPGGLNRSMPSRVPMR